MYMYEAYFFIRVTQESNVMNNNEECISQACLD